MESADVALVKWFLARRRLSCRAKRIPYDGGAGYSSDRTREFGPRRFAKAADCGWLVKPGDVDELPRVIKVIYTYPEGLLEKRQNAYLYAQAHLGQDTLVNGWLSVARYGH